MILVLFSDFGSNDLYVGQVKLVLAQRAPQVPVIDLLHDAPACNVRAGAHLLAALCARLPLPAVVIAVIDPGVGGARGAVAMRADGRWYVGPDNGLLSVVAARAREAKFWRIDAAGAPLSASFHGRDLFAPAAAGIATGAHPADDAALAQLDVQLGGDDCAEIIYVDHYGNALTGLRAGAVARDGRVGVNGQWVGHARVFAEVEPDAPFWYENSIGLVEIAVNRGNAAGALGLAVGTAVEVAAAY
ncbi:MAG TPA: SAM-dependent chlorinase/fluorinase [Burkholderiales bacterium]|nr:SAM-dependent chlorinase/fluorinase [Burkholderiales bacterium]